MGGTEIVGGAVHRVTGRWTPAVHALLRHLDDVAFAGAPRVVGFDDAGREVLTFLPSESSSRREAPTTDSALAALGRLIRAYHDAVASFQPPEGAVRRLGGEPLSGTIVCHNDINPGNVVYRGGLPYGFIDWDLAGPAPPVHDLARACILFVPLLPDDVCLAWGFHSPPDRARRLSLLRDAYGLDASIDLLAEIDALERLDLERLETLGREGVSPYGRFLATGSAEAGERELAWLEENRHTLAAALTD